MTHQSFLFPEVVPEGIINVASVPQRSPFRYPGGKTWLVPRIRQWLSDLPRRPRLFVEPFCGGGIVSLTVAAEGLAEQVLMIELDQDIAAVWQTCLSQDAEWLAQRILGFEMNYDNVVSVVEDEAKTPRELALRTIIRNRTNHGGILAPGSGLLKRGENGKGLSSRWYPHTLARRVREIAALSHIIHFVWGDGMAVIEQLANDDGVVFFIDPPYTASTKRAGSRLYTHSELDHPRLFEVTSSAVGDFLMTYDNAVEITQLADYHHFAYKTVAMKNTHHARMTELLIGRNLHWLR
jgi:DNA adenine methylase